MAADDKGLLPPHRVVAIVRPALARLNLLASLILFASLARRHCGSHQFLSTPPSHRRPHRNHYTCFIPRLPAGAVLTHARVCCPSIGATKGLCNGLGPDGARCGAAHHTLLTGRRSTPTLMDMDLDLPGRSPALESQAKCLSGSLASPSYQPSHSRSDAHGEYSPSQRPKKSTSTCSTCRFRKVRCNGARPLCSNCKRLGFPCSYEDSDVDNWSMALPRRRVKQACLNCHSRKARCSGHVPTCDRCRAQGLDCVYRPGKRSRLSVTGRDSVDIRSPDRHNGDHFDRFGDRGADCHDDSETPVSDPAATNTPSTYNHEM